MKYIKLLKLMYLADRQSFVETGYPITGAKMVSMDVGPVLSEVYSQITWGDDAETPWSQSITAAADFRVSLRQDVGELLYLSEYDEDVLGQVFDKFGHLDPWALVRFTHTLPEWKDPDGSCLPVDTRIILEEAGKSSEAIQDVAALVEGIRAMRLSSSIAR
jgi:uncharacterized phage-associated protein